MPTEGPQNSAEQPRPSRSRTALLMAVFQADAAGRTPCETGSQGIRRVTREEDRMPVDEESCLDAVSFDTISASSTPELLETGGLPGVLGQRPRALPSGGGLGVVA